jgi:hypothetical protein
MQKPPTPKQQLECEKLDVARKRAERAMHETELASGKNSPQYVVAERLRDEIIAKMQRIIGVLNGPGSDSKPAAGRVTAVVVRSKRIIKR